jgi:hypothetical protein
MFHRYVTHNGQQIDYDRASWLMGAEAFSKARSRLPEALGIDEFDIATADAMGCKTASTHTPAQELQILWDLYCSAHAEEYGKPFNPDVM